MTAQTRASVGSRLIQVREQVEAEPDLASAAKAATRFGGDEGTRSQGRTAAMVLAEARAVTEPALRAAVDPLPPEIRHVAGYHCGWWDANGRPCSHTGKAVRPALTLACARAGTADPDIQSAVVAAVAVELVHDFSLLHDDVMDGDLTRRHRPTAWAVFGVGPAILVGDVLATLAIEQIAQIPGGAAAVKLLAQSVVELCAGQSMDLAFEQREQVPLAECLRMAEGKTGALLGIACQLGALAGGAGTATATCYRDFGRHLGVAFQLVDDLLGIWGDPEVTGKPAGADLQSRKKSLPVVAALTSGTEPGRHLASVYGGDEVLDPKAIAHCADLVEAAGGRRWAQDEADRRLAQAFGCLASAAPNPDAVEDLHLLADLVTRRDH